MTDPDNPYLPEPLAAAVTEFETWMRQELEAEQSRSTPSMTLYHYTDCNALHGIIEAQSIWCFLHRQQSDKHELQFGIDIAKRVVREVAEGDNPVVNSLLHGLHGMLDLHKMNDIYEFYFFSFSRHRDDREQWKVYGRKGSGYSIGFAPELFQPNQSKLLPQANQNVFVGKVLYGRDATRDRHRRTIRR